MKGNVKKVEYWVASSERYRSSGTSLSIQGSIPQVSLSLPDEMSFSEAAPMM